MSAEPLVRVARLSAVLTVTAAAGGVAAGSVYAGAAGAYGALLGVGIPGVFFGLTLVVALVTRRRSGAALGALILGSWLLKLIGLVVALAMLKPLDFYNRPVFAVALLGWTAVLLGLEVRVIKRTQQLYVEPGP